MKEIVLGLALIIAIPGSTPLRDNYPKNPNIDALNYVFRLTLSDETDEIVGEATMDVRFKIDGITELRLDFINATRDGKGMTVSGYESVEAEAAQAHPTHEAAEQYGQRYGRRADDEPEEVEPDNLVDQC